MTTRDLRDTAMYRELLDGGMAPADAFERVTEMARKLDTPRDAASQAEAFNAAIRERARGRAHTVELTHEQIMQAGKKE